MADRDLYVGKKIERWTIVGDSVASERGERKWLCRCDCGTERYVLERSLTYGGSKSCGCLRKECSEKANSLGDLTGKLYGGLTVLHKAEHQRKNGGVWWTCRCNCGNLYDVPGSLLVTGRRTHCGNFENHPKNYASADITGKRIYRLTALYPLKERGNRGDVLWHCRCDCGNEVDIPYNNLVHCNTRSCGCQKKEHDKKLSSFLTHVAGTSLDMVKSKKIPTDNTTGYRGVYLIKGKYVAKIVFQKKAYYLGTFDDITAAAEARKEAEELLFDGSAAFYEQWSEKANADPEWAAQHPVQIYVGKDASGRLTVTFLPVLDCNPKEQD